MKIDVHNHFASARIIEQLERRTRFPYSRLVDGTHYVHCCDGLTLRMTPGLTDMDHKLAEMDRHGIDIAILSLSVPGPERIGGRKGEQMARVANDLLAEIIAGHPNRFRGYATLAFGDLDMSLKELDRCISVLKFSGLLLYSNINGKPLDLPEFRPFFARMAELRRPIFIHPTVPINRTYLMDLVPAPVLAFIVDNTLAAMRLALAGMLLEYDGAPIIIPHAGAAIPYLMGRLDGMIAAFGGAGAPAQPSELLKKLYMDTVVYSPEPLKWCLSLMGAGRLVFGTDYPYAQWERASELAGRMECPESDRELILNGNARSLFGL